MWGFLFLRRGQKRGYEVCSPKGYETINVYLLCVCVCVCVSVCARAHVCACVCVCVDLPAMSQLGGSLPPMWIQKAPSSATI